MFLQGPQRQIGAQGLSLRELAIRRPGSREFWRKRMACFEGSRPWEFCPANAVSTHIPFPFQEWMTVAKRADFQ
jgi:hypothetical protein